MFVISYIVFGVFVGWMKSIFVFLKMRDYLKKVTGGFVC